MAQPVDQFIKCLKLTRLAATDVFGRAAPRAIINRVAIRPQADDECGFTGWWLHDLEVSHFFAQHHQFRSFLNSRRARSSNRLVSVR